MHPIITFCLYADDSQLFIHMSHKNAVLAFEKLISFLQDVEKWVLSYMLKLNLEKKTEFIIFEFHAQLKKIDSH